MADLKRGDVSLLRRVMASNGGGVMAEGMHEFRHVPIAQERRLLKLGLVRRKPGQALMLIHTNETAAAIAAEEAVTQ